MQICVFLGNHLCTISFGTSEENCLGESSRVNMTPPIISVAGSFGLELGAEPSVKITISDFREPEPGIGLGGPCITSVRHLYKE